MKIYPFVESSEQGEIGGLPQLADGLNWPSAAASGDSPTLREFPRLREAVI